MARFKRLKVLQHTHRDRHRSFVLQQRCGNCKKVVKACYAGGARVFEFTNREIFAHEVFAEVNKWCAGQCPEMIMGVGSVVDSATAALYIQLGGPTLLSPQA